MLQVPSSLAVALNGIIVIFVISSSRVRSWLQTTLGNTNLFGEEEEEEEEEEEVEEEAST